MFPSSTVKTRNLRNALDTFFTPEKMSGFTHGRYSPTVTLESELWAGDTFHIQYSQTFAFVHFLYRYFGVERKSNTGWSSGWWQKTNMKPSVQVGVDANNLEITFPSSNVKTAELRKELDAFFTLATLKDFTHKPYTPTAPLEENLWKGNTFRIQYSKTFDFVHCLYDYFLGWEYGLTESEVRSVADVKELWRKALRDPERWWEYTVKVEPRAMPGTLVRIDVPELKYSSLLEIRNILEIRNKRIYLSNPSYVAATHVTNSDVLLVQEEEENVIHIFPGLTVSTMSIPTANHDFDVRGLAAFREEVYGLVTPIEASAS